jgi:hypothetical protein
MHEALVLISLGGLIHRVGRHHLYCRRYAGLSIATNFALRVR